MEFNPPIHLRKWRL